MSRVARAFAPAHLGELTGILPAEVVDEVLERTRRQERRVRLLPARVVVYFVLAMAMFPGQGYRGVWARLVAGLDDSVPYFPSARALRLARNRLGTEPMAELFRRICGTVSGTSTRGVWWRGLRVVAWDGTGIDVAASAANTSFYGLPTGGRGPSGYPQVRLVAMVECGTRALMDAVWAPRATGETVLATRLVRSLKAGMLLLADRGFDGYELWGEALTGGADLLWRVNGRRLLTPLCEFPDGSYTALLPERGDQRRRCNYRSRGKTLPGEPIGHRVRVIEYDITVSTSDGDMRTEHIRLVTTLRDAGLYPAGELAELYHRRWEIETAYFSLKVSLRGARTVLRSHVPEGVDQELYAFLIVYQMLRGAMHLTALAADIPPDRLSFTVALRGARDSLIKAAITPKTHTDGRLHQSLIREVLPRRRDRVSPRAVKRPVSTFAQRQLPALRAKGRAALQATYKIVSRISGNSLTNTEDP